MTENNEHLALWGGRFTSGPSPELARLSKLSLIHICATSEDAALACGRAVAASNLLKCAISGNDPNWGRIVSSLGKMCIRDRPWTARNMT